MSPLIDSPMKIVCPSCQTSYDVSAASLGAEGRQVRCVRCKEIWFATPSEDPATAAEAAGMSAAAASAQYRRGAGANADPAPGAADDPWGQADQADHAAGDDVSVDPNLAARAADRSGLRFEDPPMADAGAEAFPDTLAAHDAPPLAPAADAQQASSEPADDIETFAARRARRERLRNQRRSGRPSVTTVLIILFAIAAALIGWRTDVVRVMPQTASLFAAIGLPVNLRGLAFSDVTTVTEAHDGVTMLLVQGTITNVSRQPRDVPRIRLAMKNNAGAEVYAWTSLPVRTTLAPGDSEPFRTRLASPPPEGHALEVRFFHKRDIVRGGR
jgi:predicted Zn finger-like uncharacterized protein